MEAETMATITVEYTQCDFCLRKMQKHLAYAKFGYMSDGAGTYHDFCDDPGCQKEAREIADKHVGIQVWWPKSGQTLS
jgi:hypothetical protein